MNPSTDSSPAVLVTDGEYISALAAVRSLGAGGYRVIVASHRRLAHSFYSRHCAHRLLVPDPKADPRGFVEALYTAYSAHGCEALVPVYTHTIRAVLEYGGDRFRTLLPPREAVETAEDKARLWAWAHERNYPVPRSVVWNRESALRETCEKAGLAPPLVAKSAIGEGAVEVRYIGEWNELESRVADLPAGRDVLIQQRLTGAGWGVSCLFGRDGRLIARFVHRRLREIPPSGGASVLRESADWPELAETGSSILRDLGWRGLAMVEFKTDVSGRPYLLEINPRFWGSMPLAVAAGVDFPRLYAEEVLSRSPRPVLDCRAGVRVHRLLFAGLYVLPHYLRASPRPLATLAETFGRGGGGFRDDILSLRDPLPALARLAYSILDYVRRWRKRGVDRA